MMDQAAALGAPKRPTAKARRRTRNHRSRSRRPAISGLAITAEQIAAQAAMPSGLTVGLLLAGPEQVLSFLSATRIGPEHLKRGVGNSYRGACRTSGCRAATAASH